MRKRKLTGADLGVVGDLAVTETVAMRHEGVGLTAAADRKALLERVRAGEALTLEFDATTFIQRATPNRNFVRVRDGALSRLARTFRGEPFLRDHASRTLDARAGTILTSELVRTENDASIAMTVRAIKPWAVEGLLDGTIDRFSVGFRATGPLECSIHRKDWMECRCWPGDTVDGKVMEIVFTEAEGVEVSSVNVPAVVGTGVDGIRAALAALYGPPEEGTMFNELLTRLGLPEGATEADGLAAVERLQTALEASRQASKVIEIRLAAVEAEAAQHRAAQLDAEMERLYQAGKIPLARDAAGKRIAHPLETSLRAMAVQDRVQFDALVAALPASATIAPLQSQTPVSVPVGADGTHVHRTAARFGVDPTGLQRQLRAMGITDEQLVKYGPDLGEGG